MSLKSQIYPTELSLHKSTILDRIKSACYPIDYENNIMLTFIIRILRIYCRLIGCKLFTLFIISATIIYWYFGVVGLLNIKTRLDAVKILPRDSPLQKPNDILSNVVWAEYHPVTILINTPFDVSNRNQTTRFWQMVGQDMNDLMTRFTGKINGRIVDRFWLTVAYENTSSWETRIELMSDWRKVISRYSDLNATVWEPNGMFVDQMLSLKTVAMQTGVLTLACMAVVCAIFIPNPCSVITASVAIASISLGVMGFLSWWHFDLDPVVMAAVLMSIGMSVDFIAHVSYHYQLTNKKEIHDGKVVKIPVCGPQEKLEHTLEAVGWPMIQAGVSTICCILPLLFLASYSTSVFVAAIFLVVSWGALHGLVLQILPSFLGSLPDCLTNANCYRTFLSTSSEKSCRYVGNKDGEEEMEPMEKSDWQKDGLDLLIFCDYLSGCCQIFNFLKCNNTHKYQHNKITPFTAHTHTLAKKADSSPNNNTSQTSKTFASPEAHSSLSDNSGRLHSSSILSSSSNYSLPSTHLMIHKEFEENRKSPVVNLSSQSFSDPCKREHHRKPLTTSHSIGNVESFMDHLETSSPSSALHQQRFVSLQSLPGRNLGSSIIGDDCLVSGTPQQDELPLPPNWAVEVTLEGFRYYVDHTTRRTHWIHPLARENLPLGWSKIFQQNTGVIYYNNRYYIYIYIYIWELFSIVQLEQYEDMMLKLYKQEVIDTFRVMVDIALDHRTPSRIWISKHGNRRQETEFIFTLTQGDQSANTYILTLGEDSRKALSKLIV
uniref:WW domain-containing protein n=1 Tax=Heterorhabditis bacteriophora TaxID=37862 RepID=A0A1I7WSP7_HETBA